MILTDPYEIAKFIKEADKKTDVIAFIKLNEKIEVKGNFQVFGSNDDFTIVGDYKDVKQFINQNKNSIKDIYIHNNARNSAIDLLDIKEINARIEPGAIIRDHVTIKDQAVIMMGAIINIGASVGEKTMIDMGAILGARAQIGNNSHIGAGAVVAGVLEPPSKSPVIIGDNVLIGANAVVLEGVSVGNGAVVGAGSVVTQDVLENEVVVGNPARVVKKVDDKTLDKSKILEDLR